MRDDPDFNINFVAAVQAKPCVYDNTNLNYTNRNVQDRAWELISKEVNEPVPDCKDRWKNIRGSYTRYLKYKYTQGRKKKKPYYLAEYLKFLRPYTKTRPPNSTVAASVPTNDLEGDESESGNDQDNETVYPKIKIETLEYSESSPVLNSNLASNNTEYSSSDTQQSTTTPLLRKTSRQYHKNPDKSVRGAFNKSTFEYLKSAALKNEERLQDPDVSFLMSVLPDMKKMNDSQRRRFKISILESAVNILDGNSNSSTLELMEG